jgi:hypothetical protein
MANSVVRYPPNYGVIKFTLKAGSYDFRFMTVSGATPDSGTAQCH